jgi:hypothetical protein
MYIAQWFLHKTHILMPAGKINETDQWNQFKLNKYVYQFERWAMKMDLNVTLHSSGPWRGLQIPRQAL